VIAAAEVYGLREAKDEGPVDILQTVALLRAKVQRLEVRCGVLERILDAKDAPLAVTPQYAANLYSLCIRQLGAGSWSKEEMENWSEIFLRLQEEDLIIIMDATRDPKPWLPFLRLSVRMAHWAVSSNSYKTDLALQATHIKLAEGRRRLRTSAVIFAESRGITDSSLGKYSAADVPSSLGDLLVQLGRRRK